MVLSGARADGHLAKEVKKGSNKDMSRDEVVFSSVWADARVQKLSLIHI